MTDQENEWPLALLEQVLENDCMILIFIQVPNDGISENSLKSFIEDDVPVFGLIGQHINIDPLKDYDISEDARLVYKYMKAYTTGRINSIWVEGIYAYYCL